MSMLTMKTIMQTFSEMIEEMPFDKITVLALVKRCEINLTLSTITFKIYMSCLINGYSMK